MNVVQEGIGMTSQRTRNRLVDRLRQEGIKDERVLETVRNIPRHLFMDEAISSRAYEDTALPIGFGQTISQPYIVARMTEALIEDGLPDKTLEIGTGSGYQTAILASLVKQVFTIERIGPLLEQAKKRMAALNCHNINFKHGDGYEGWQDEGLFDGIIVTAAPAEIPDSLPNQLADGGRLVIPFGPAGSQQLVKITRHADEFERQVLDWVSFVPLKEGTVS